jgi:hypothetical protein
MVEKLELGRLVLTNTSISATKMVRFMKDMSRLRNPRNGERGSIDGLYY